ncbi:MAG: hypothetical protein J6C92_14875 [Bacteroidaceae bacterium]|nr:hypothetical protein [Bacteroidaceae bacterium]
MYKTSFRMYLTFCLLTFHNQSAETEKTNWLVQCAGPAPAGGYPRSKPPILRGLNAYHIATLTLHI